MTEIETGGPRRRGRDRQAAGPRSRLPEQKAFRQPRMKYAPTKVISDDEVEAIHHASLRVLSDIGIDFLLPEALELIAKSGGAKISDNRVRFDPAFVEETIKTCPSEFKLHSRNPNHTLNIGGDWMAFGSVASPPNFMELDGTRHAGNRQNFQDLLKLTQSFNIVHFTAGYPVEPVDLHASIRHLECTYDMLTMTDKPIHCYSLGRQRNRDVLEMSRIVRGIDDATLDDEPSVFTIINSSSPLRLDIPMLQGIMEYSARNQIIVITPFTLAGAMAPITLAGALSLQNAEALAGMVFTQLVRPGSPVMYGGFTSNVDMQSGAPAFGTPEYMRTAMAGGQLARRYKVPFRSSNVCAANALDAQAAYESVFSLWGAIQGGVNFLMHGAGWMEGGLHASLEKFVLDADLLAMVADYLEPIVVDESTLAFEAIQEVGPAGHFFGTQHTQDRFRDAFYKPLISDWRNYESWEEAGKPTADQKAKQLAQAYLEEFVAPELDPAIHEELLEFKQRRVAEGGVATDF